MTDEEDRNRVVSPDTIPMSGAIGMDDEDDEDRTAVMSAAARAQALEAAALARAPLDFDLTGGSDDAPLTAGSVDFDLTGGEDIADESSHGALDLDLGSGETSIPEVVASSAAPLAAAASASAPAATSSAPLSPGPTPSSGGGIGKWIAIAFTIGVLVLAAVYLL